MPSFLFAYYGAEEAKMTAEMAFIQYLVQQVGSAYVFGADGQNCTPAFRQRVAQAQPQWAAQIVRCCPVLSGGQGDCRGCKYQGRPAFDCRGLTRQAVRAALGRPLLGAGASSQWRDGRNWQERGLFGARPRGALILFRQNKNDPNVMDHTGAALDYTSYVHAGGHASGVTQRAIAGGWTHWAIPAGFYRQQGTDEGGKPMAELYFRMSVQPDERVRALQKALAALGFDVGSRTGADGLFGIKTEAAVMAFQQKYGLEKTGRWGQREAAKLVQLEAAKPAQPMPGAPTPVQPPKPQDGPPQGAPGQAVATLQAIRRLADEALAQLSR